MRQTHRNSAMPGASVMQPLYRRVAVLMLIVLTAGSAMAGTTRPGNDVGRLVKLLPDRVSAEAVKAIFGEATIITINNKTDEEWWQYKNDDKDIYFKWDTKTGALRSLTYNSHDKIKENWSNANLGSAYIGSSTLKQVIGLLGDPTNIYLMSTGNTLKYSYADAMVTFQFKKGVLYSIVVTAAEKKEGTTITIE